jgi:hypothetical protein
MHLTVQIFRALPCIASVFTYWYLHILAKSTFLISILTLILLTWRKWWAPHISSRWQLGFNLAFKGLILSFLILVCLSRRSSRNINPINIKSDILKIWHQWEERQLTYMLIKIWWQWDLLVYWRQLLKNWQHLGGLCGMICFVNCSWVDSRWR